MEQHLLVKQHYILSDFANLSTGQIVTELL